MSDPLDSDYDFTDSINWEYLEKQELRIGDDNNEDN
jgi:hypothetical protein